MCDTGDRVVGDAERYGPVREHWAEWHSLPISLKTASHRCVSRSRR